MNAPLRGRTIVLGISGSIAIYRAADVVRALRRDGARVIPVLTRAAAELMHPRTFSSLAGEAARVDLFSENTPSFPHLDLSREADAVVVAPATADILGKMAAGIADDLLSTLILVVSGPVIVAPAMNPRMYRNDVVGKNLIELRRRGFVIVGPRTGAAACGDHGLGRMSSPADIVGQVRRALWPDQRLCGRRVLITAGPTRERWDRVRFLSNYSSGKMGYALAETGYERGVDVVLVSGPTCLQAPAGVELRRVESAVEMQQEVLREFPRCDGVIMAAAVADFQPATVWPDKIKKQGRDGMNLDLMRTPDILENLVARRHNQVLIGFCADTGDLEAAARAKQDAKPVDLLVANDIGGSETGFTADTNRALLLDRQGILRWAGTVTKQRLAHLIWDRFAELLGPQSSGGVTNC